jgi:lysyl-tRNA synthetase class I
MKSKCWLITKEEFKDELWQLVESAIKFGAERRTLSDYKRCRKPDARLIRGQRDAVHLAKSNMAYVMEDVQDSFAVVLGQRTDAQKTLLVARESTNAMEKRIAQKVERKINNRYQEALSCANRFLLRYVAKDARLSIEDALARIEASTVSEKQVLGAIAEFENYKSETKQ